MLKSLRAILVIAFAGFWVTACGGGGSGSPAAATPVPPDTQLIWDEGNWDERNWQ
jgi:hypothetical protein